MGKKKVPVVPLFSKLEQEYAKKLLPKLLETKEGIQATQKATKFIKVGSGEGKGGVTPQYQKRIELMKKWLEEPKTQYQYENLINKFIADPNKNQGIIIDNTYLGKNVNLGKGSNTYTGAQQVVRTIVKKYIPEKYDLFLGYGRKKQSIKGKEGQLKQVEETHYPAFLKSVQDATKLADEGRDPRVALLQSVKGEDRFNMSRLLRESFPLYAKKLIIDDPKAYKFLSNYINQDKAIDARLYGTDFSYFGDFTKGDNPLEYGLNNSESIPINSPCHKCVAIAFHASEFSSGIV